MPCILVKGRRTSASLPASSGPCHRKRRARAWRLSTPVDAAAARLERGRAGWHSPRMSNHPLRTRSELERLAALVGTPFYFYDAAVIAQRIALVQEQIAAPGI